MLSLLVIALAYPVASRYLSFRESGDPANASTSTAPSFESSNPKAFFKQQYLNPAETFSVLLLIGGDIVQKAIAQLVGHKLWGYNITPTAFSFGWVAYSFNALNSALSDGSLMPAPDTYCRVINLSSGGSRDNESWVIGRLLRDLELDKDLDLSDKKPAFTFLTAEGVPGVPKADLVWWSFAGFLPLQLVLAAIPIILPQRNWAILMITAVGSLLAMITGSLPHWMEEKYACRKDSKDVFILTRGNGHQHIFVIENKGFSQVVGKAEDGRDIIVRSLNMEDLATQSPKSTLLARAILIFLAIAWVFFLITAAGIEQDTWYLLLVGGLGMGHNVYAANAVRRPSAHGVPLAQTRLKTCKRIKADPGQSAMAVLKKAEEARPGLGLAVLHTFFPGRLRPNEVSDWESARGNLEERKAAFKKGLTILDPWADRSERTNAHSHAQIGLSPSQPARPQRTPTMPSSSI